MNWQIIVIIVIIIIIYWHFSHKKPKNRKKLIMNLDEPNERKQFLKQTDNECLQIDNNSINSDDLFTRATLFLRMADDIQDKLQFVNPIERLQLLRKLSQVMNDARVTIREAIHKRNTEIPDEEPIFHNDALRMRAEEIDLQAMETPIELQPLTPPAQIVMKIVPSQTQKWMPDPENVHDSAVGSDVIKRIQHLRQNDKHLIKNCVDSVSSIIQRKKIEDIDDKKYTRILRTFQQAQENAYCGRYSISEMESIRLVLEHALQAATEEKKHNLEDALLESMDECAYKTTNGTVCLIGRISRYVSSMDGIDENITDIIKPVDAYRNEILASIGKVSATQIDVKNLHAEINKICDEYKNKIPDHCLKKIREECLMAIE